MNQEVIKQKTSAHVCQAEPIVGAKKKKYTKKDLWKIQFSSGDKNLSRNIDKILYDI